jgi:hypothetical protein
MMTIKTQHDDWMTAFEKIRLWLPRNLLGQPYVSALLANCWISSTHDDGDEEFIMPDHIELGWTRQVFMRARREVLNMGWVKEVRVPLPRPSAPALYCWSKTAQAWHIGVPGRKDVVLVSVCPCCRMVRPIPEAAGRTTDARHRMLSS